MIFYVLLSGCLPITLINSLEGFSQCILSKHLVYEHPSINRQRKSEERRALKVKKHSEFLKLKTGVSKVHFVLEKPLRPSMKEFCMMLCGYPIDSLRTQEMRIRET